MSDIKQAGEALVDRILEGDGLALRAQRRAAFNNAAIAEPLRTLIEKVAERANEIADTDIAAARAAGFSEDQIFEIVVCAAVGAATRRYAAALAALDAATRKG